MTELGCFEDCGVGDDDVLSRLSALAKSCTGGFYHGARRDARAERPKEVVLEDCSSDERKTLRKRRSTHPVLNWLLN